jgi:hypothetical protein
MAIRVLPSYFIARNHLLPSYSNTAGIILQKAGGAIRESIKQYVRLRQ